MAYCNNNSTIHLEKILPIGAINYINIFKTTNSKPNLSPGIYKPIVVGGTEFYHNKNINITVIVDYSEVRNLIIEYE
jgi:hypothetical protein